MLYQIYSCQSFVLNQDKHNQMPTKSGLHTNILSQCKTIWSATLGKKLINIDNHIFFTF